LNELPTDERRIEMTNKHLCIVAAAALAVGGMGLTSAMGQDTPPADRSAAERAGDAARDAGQAAGQAAQDAEKAASDAARAADTPAKNTEEIHDVLAQVAEAALTKEGLDDMVERFVDADRNRLGQNQNVLKDTQELDGRIAQIRNDWKAKYNEDFDITDEEKVYGGFAMIAEGEIGAPRTAGDRVRAPAEGVDAPKTGTDGQTAADRNLNDPGRNIATVTIPEKHGLKAVTVPMIHEAGGWKIDIPDSVDANKLREAVKTALTKVGDMKDQWPADKNESYRIVSHYVLAQLFADQQQAGAPGAPGAAQPAAGQAQPQPATPAQPQ
jgi:hypothetical protein